VVVPRRLCAQSLMWDVRRHGGTALKSMSVPRQIGGLAGWLLLCFAAAAVGAIASVNAGSFYLAA
jgi:hypothetical protein